MLIWALRIIHISSGILWAGYGIFAILILLPAVADLGPAGGAVMGALMKRKLSPYVAATAGLSVLSGLALFAINFSGAWMQTSTGQLLALGGLSGVAAFAYGIAVSVPKVKKIEAISIAVKSAGGAPNAAQAAELAALGAALTQAAKVNALLLGLAALCMAASRYAPQF
jgi:hypothetical protein